MEEPDADSDQHQDELSDAVDDGGGCAETWEKLSEARHELTPDRRSFLKNAGVLTTFALVPGTSRALPSGDDIHVLEDNEKGPVLSRMRRTDEYQALFSEIRDREYRIRFTPRHTTVIRVSKQVDPRNDVDEETDPELRTVEVAYTEILDNDGDEAYLSIGIDADTNEVLVSGVEFIETEIRDPDETPFDLDGIDSAAEVPVEAELIGADGATIETETYTLEDLAEPPTFDEGDVVAADDIFCFNCRLLVGQLCFYGCGLPIWFLCGLLAIPTGGIGGLACGAFVLGACAALSYYSCDFTNVNRRVCEDIGQC